MSGLSSIGGGFFGAARNAASNAASAVESAAESAVAVGEKTVGKAESMVEAAEAVGSASALKLKVPSSVKPYNGTSITGRGS